MAPMASPPQVRREPRDPPPRAAGATVAAAIQQRQPSISSVVAQNAYQKSRQQRPGPTPKARSPPPKINNVTDDDSDLDGFDSSGEEDLDIFYTPNQSPRTSMASSSILFPSKPRNTTPRQASRKSLRTSNTSSVAPGIAPSNSNSSINKSSPNINGTSAPPPAMATPAPMPQLNGAQQQRQAQPRPSNSNNGPTAPNGIASRRPAPQTAQASTSKATLQQPQPSRKPSIPSAVSPPVSSINAPPRPPQVQGPIVPRLPSVPSPAPAQTRANSIKIPSTNDTSAKPSRASSTLIRSGTSSASPNSSFSTAASNSTSSTQKHPAIPKQKSKRVPPTLSNSPSTVSLSSTSLENHSDTFSTGSASDMLTESTTVTSPLNSLDGGRGVSRKPAPQINGSAKSPPARSASLRATRTPLPPRSQTFNKPPIVNVHAQVQKSYAYTDDDWAKDVRSLVNLHSALEESLNEKERVEKAAAAATATAGAGMKRNASASSKKDDRRKSLGRGPPPDTIIEEVVVSTIDKGKAKEKDGKIKRKKTGATPDTEVVYYTAKHGTPRPVSLNGAINGVGSGPTRGFSSPVPANQQPTPSSGRNGFHLQPSIMMNMSALMEQDEGSDGRLSVVTEREEPETPTTPSMHTMANGEPHLSGVFNAFAPLRPTANSSARPVEMMRRRSRSVGEHDAEEHLQKPRQSSVASWADEYKDILAKTRAHAMASGTSLLSSPSQNSFAVRSALPIGNGELSSQGTPGHTSLHLARTPPGVYTKDGEVHQRSGPNTQPGGLFSNFRGAISGGSSGTIVNGRVDLTRSRIAQTTMASVEVVKGLGGVKRGLSGVFSLGGLGRRRTVSGDEGMDLLERKRKRVRKGSEDLNGSGRASTDQTTGKTPGTLGSPDRVLGFTGYRRPPTYVPSGSVLVQIWAVGVDGVDARLVGLRMGKRQVAVEDEEEERVAGETGGQGEEGREQMNGVDGQKEGESAGKEVNGKPPGRSVSLRSRLGSISRRKRSLSLKGGWKKDADGEGKGKGKDKSLPAPPISHANVGYIPGRSFVGRVLDCGWDVKDETIRKGEWVVGLLDVRKGGALTEFVVVDRHRIHRIPYPSSMPGSDPPPMSSSSETTNTNSSGSSSRTAKPPTLQSLSLDQLALLPLCGVPAYRAVRTFMYAFSSQYKPPTSPRGQQPSSGAEFLGGRSHLLSDHEPNRSRRALVLRGHDGIGAMAVQMLSLRGWRVSVHVPVTGPHDSEDAKQYMLEVEERVRKLGGEEVVFDDGGKVSDPWWDDGRTAAVRVIEGLKDDGDVFDAVLDTLGGREIREASERLLKSHGTDEEAGNGKAMIYLDGQSPEGKGTKKSGVGQFTTIVGEVPERPIPTTADNFRAGLRSLKFGGGGNGGGGGAREGNGEDGKTKVGYAWISVAQDVDWEGDDVAESIGNVLRLAMDHSVKPVVPRASTTDEYAPEYHWQHGVIPMEKTPEVFVNGDGPLSGGGTMVIKVAA